MTKDSDAAILENDARNGFDEEDAIEAQDKADEVAAADAVDAEIKAEDDAEHIVKSEN